MHCLGLNQFQTFHLSCSAVPIHQQVVYSGGDNGMCSQAIACLVEAIK